MTYGTYLRLDITVHEGWREVVRAAAKKLTPEARRDPTKREVRHRFYRQMLDLSSRAAGDRLVLALVTPISR